MKAPDQAWFWTPEWQAGEAQVDREVAANQLTQYPSGAAFLESLQQAAAYPERADVRP